MARSMRHPTTKPTKRLKDWLLAGYVRDIGGPYAREQHQHKHPWWQVMCLTGVDYFSTLGYQPAIAALAAGALSPVATVILVLLTLFGALPIYSRVADESPHGEGSISILENLLSWWQGKLFVLVLLGFAATDFIITITLSAADATAHIAENPFTPHFLVGHEVAITLTLILLLGLVFFKGFKEAIGIAMVVVVVYLLMNAVVIVTSIYHILLEPSVVSNWTEALFARQSNPIMMLAVGLLLFPRLALGLSGFETGVAVMPLVRGDPHDTSDRPAGRIRNTRKLLLAAALIMSVYLIFSSLVTTILIPHEAFEEGGPASGRALAYLAHQYLGDLFGTAYDLSTIMILWFAGASAMAGLLNIVPRYLPRYGMAPDWARAMRPLVLVFTLIAFTVTIIFDADVEAQGGAYATGVLVLMTSAAVAVTLSARRNAERWKFLAFGLITLIFVYTTIVNILERPEGIKIATFFIVAIVITSLLSRAWRSTELRVERIELDEKAEAFIRELSQRQGEIHIVANRRQRGDLFDYRSKELEQREDNRIPASKRVYFLEIDVADASEFTDVLEVRGVEAYGYKIFRAESSVVPNAIAAFLLYLRDRTGRLPHCYFSWGEGNPLKYLFRFLIFGEGDIAPLTHEVLRRAEPDQERRPAVHVGG